MRCMSRAPVCRWHTRANASASTSWADAASDDDGALYDEYAAAKDGSRRVIGKHGRNTRLAVQRMYAIDARTRQRTGGGSGATG